MLTCYLSLLFHRYDVDARNKNRQEIKKHLL